MKFLKVNWHIPELIKWHVENFGDFDSDESYSQQIDQFYAQMYWPGNSLEKNMEKLGYVSNSLLFSKPDICDIVSLNDAWSKEYNIVISKERIYNTLLKQISFYNPDILYLQAGWMFDSSFFDEIRSCCLDIKLIIISCGTYLKEQHYINAKSADIVITVCDNLKIEFIKRGVNSEVLRHAFDERVLKHIQTARNKANKILFSGSIGGRFVNDVQRHSYRNDIVRYLYARTGKVDILSPKSEYIKKFENVKPPQFGIRRFDTISQYSVSINVQSEAAGNSASNVRLYEIPGVGTCLLTDHKDDLEELFDIDKEVVSFNSKEEALDKAEYLLKNPDIAKKIGDSGQKRILKNHTYLNRAKELDAIIQKHLKS
ncbi:MAG: glycosyltransferase [Campylobacterales bacterium]